MPNNVTTQGVAPATLPVNTTIAADDVAGVLFQKMKLDVGGAGVSVLLDTANPLPVRIMSGIEVEVKNDVGSPLAIVGAVTGPVTNAELRAAAVPVVGPITNAELRAVGVPVLGPLTDVQLRAAAVPVSGPLTDAQLRATALPVSETASSRSATLTRASAPGNIAVNARNASIYNAGAANGTVLGAVLKPGETVDFDAGGQKDILGVIAYDATGTDFLVLRIG